MSSEKNPEVVGCDASIMKNVWEIREREYGQKMHLEQERIERSALPSINKDWENRLVAKLGNYKRVERKIKPAENQTNKNNVWKSKQHQVPPTLPCGSGSGPLGRPVGQRRGFSTPVPNYKDKKGQDKNFNRLHLIMFITRNQPSAMVWGKSWKFNKSLPLPAEGAAAGSDWGKCWIFATPQLHSEEGKPCPNSPNMMDPYGHHLWKKPHRVVESQELDLSLPTEEWQMSWRKFDNKKMDTCSVNGTNVPKSGFFTFLLETQHHNEAFCSSEWSKSWRSTKPTSQQDNFTVTNDGLINGSIANNQDDNGEISFKWEECWRLVNHHGCNKSKLPQVKKSLSPEWADSWRAAMVVFNNHKNSDPSMRQDHKDKYDHGQQKEAHLYIVKTYRDLYLQLRNEFKALSEWSESWQVTKNNSKPCEEIKKVLKVSPPRMEAQKVEKNPKGHYLISEKADSYYEQLKHNVIYCPKKEFTQSKLINLKHLENVLSTSEWRDSWKTLKHRMRMERRIRPDPSRPFRASEKGGDMKPNTSEWKDSWIFTCQPLRQEPELWEQGWSTMPQIQVHHGRDQNLFAPVELPKNGPTREQSWGESWKLSRPQNPAQCRAQTSQARSSVTSHHPYDSWTHSRYARSIYDWQEAWMVSETQFHHDKPSLTKWREAWKCSIFHTGLWTEQKPRENGGDVLMEIQPRREKISLQRAKAKMSWSFDSQMFRERYPEKHWSGSWRAGSLLKHQPSHYRSSGIPWNSMTATTQQQHATFNEHGSKWGRSFRLANPMPHVDQPWVESSPNPCHNIVMWSRGNNTQNNIKTNFRNNSATIRLWENSHQFLQRASAQMKDKTTSKEPADPRMNITKKNKTSRHLYSNTEKEKQSERKWAGCHLLGKTQPRPKRGPASVKKLNMEDKNKDTFFEEWAESWKSFVHPSGLKKQMHIKSLSDWDMSWKFLLPLYKPMNGPKTK